MVVVAVQGALVRFLGLVTASMIGIRPAYRQLPQPWEYGGGSLTGLSHDEVIPFIIIHTRCSLNLQLGSQTGMFYSSVHALGMFSDAF
jgi:hypothetical protein